MSTTATELAPLLQAVGEAITHNQRAGHTVRVQDPLLLTVKASQKWAQVRLIWPQPGEEGDAGAAERIYFVSPFGCLALKIGESKFYKRPIVCRINRLSITDPAIVQALTEGLTVMRKEIPRATSPYTYTQSISCTC